MFLVALVCIAISCNNDDDAQLQFESTAVISGLDATLCGCCGGWIITIDGQDFINRFSELPQGANIDLQNENFPLNVQLNWSESEEFCGNGVRIESIDLVQ